MKITNRIKSAINGFTKTENAYSEQQRLARSFLKNGNRSNMLQDWTGTLMTDESFYQGYSYAAINVRANKLADLAINNIVTTGNDETKEHTHPYLEIIDKSKTFSNYNFWHNISTYLDLEGVYYLLAIRNVQGDRIGNIQNFKLTNPYNIRRVINEETGEIGGYVEHKRGMTRELQPQLIIPIQKLNPFDEDTAFAMTDAAKEYQFTLKQASDYTRHALKNNINTPGIISTDVILPQEQFENFKARVTNQEKGMPIFGNGAGTIKWEPMNVDLDKSSLQNINEINRSTLFAVSGVGKTIMGIEESGTTRETSKTQRNLFIENHVAPQLQLIIDALNQDYKNYYDKEYEKSGYEMVIDIDLDVDKNAELLEKQIDLQVLDNKKAELELYDALRAKAFTDESILDYIKGEIEVTELVVDKKLEAELEEKRRALEEKMQPQQPEVEDKPEEKVEEVEEPEEKPANQAPINNTLIKYNITNKGDEKQKDISLTLEDIKSLNEHVMLKNAVKNNTATDEDEKRFIELMTNETNVAENDTKDKVLQTILKDKEASPVFAYYVDNSLYGLLLESHLEGLEDVHFKKKLVENAVNTVVGKKLTYNEYKILTDDYDEILNQIQPRVIKDKLQCVVKVSGYTKNIAYESNIVLNRDTNIKINSAKLVKQGDRYYIEVNTIIDNGE